MQWKLCQKDGNKNIEGQRRVRQGKAFYWHVPKHFLSPSCPPVLPGKPHPDHLMGPPSCHSDLRLTWHLKAAFAGRLLPHVRIDDPLLTRDCEPQGAMSLSALPPTYSQHLGQILACSSWLIHVGLMMIKITPAAFMLLHGNFKLISGKGGQIWTLVLEESWLSASTILHFSST